MTKIIDNYFLRRKCSIDKYRHLNNRMNEFNLRFHMQKDLWYIFHKDTRFSPAFATIDAAQAWLVKKKNWVRIISRLKEIEKEIENAKKNK